MRYSRLLAPLVFVLLAACASAGGSPTVAPDELRTGLTLAQAGYTGYCAATHAKFCTPANDAKVAAAAQAANDAISTYADALASGQPTDAVLAHASALVADVAALVASLKNGA